MATAPRDQGDELIGVDSISFALRRRTDTSTEL
jgi:hypothetical protein